jgi:hypothetical protein
MAERQGFEPWVGLHPQRFSRPPRSTTPAPLLRAGDKTCRAPVQLVFIPPSHIDVHGPLSGIGKAQSAAYGRLKRMISEQTMGFILKLRRSFAFCAVPLLLSAGTAHSNTEADALLDLVGAHKMISIMRDEGITYSAQLADDMIPGGADQSWVNTMDRLYNVDAMTETVSRSFSKELQDTDLAPLTEFFSSQDGRRIVGLEISAREAMQDPEIEEAARETARRFARAQDDIYLLAQEMIEAGDLIEANVVGALNANIDFYQGLVDGGALEMSADEIFADVWSQEEGTRKDTRDWLIGYMVMAYSPLETGALEQYIALSKSPAGQSLNRALFQGFDAMYREISYALGLATARAMKAQDI